MDDQNVTLHLFEMRVLGNLALHSKFRDNKHIDLLFDGCVTVVSLGLVPEVKSCLHALCPSSHQKEVREKQPNANHHKPGGEK